MIGEPKQRDGGTMNKLTPTQIATLRVLRSDDTACIEVYGDFSGTITCRLSSSKAVYHRVRAATFRALQYSGMIEPKYMVSIYGTYRPYVLSKKGQEAIL